MHGRDIPELTEVQDIAPTLPELCGIKPKNRYPMDGVSWAGLLRQEAWPYASRKLAIEYGVSGKRWVDACVPSEKWRLLEDGKSLFNVASDPHQDRNVAGQNTGVFQGLNSYYDQWYQQAYAEFSKIRYIHLGHPGIPEVILYASDWQGIPCDNPGTLAAGTAKVKWNVEVEATGDYRVEFSRWPFESGKALTEGAKDKESDSNVAESTFKSVEAASERRKNRHQLSGARPIAKAQLLIADFNQTTDTKPADKSAKFTLHLNAGKTDLTANFLDIKGNILCGAFYVKVTQLK